MDYNFIVTQILYWVLLAMFLLMIWIDRKQSKAKQHFIDEYRHQVDFLLKENRSLRKELEKEQHGSQK